MDSKNPETEPDWVLPRGAGSEWGWCGEGSSRAACWVSWPQVEPVAKREEGREHAGHWAGSFGHLIWCLIHSSHYHRGHGPFLHFTDEHAKAAPLQLQTWLISGVREENGVDRAGLKARVRT